jgi:two-component system KDP operon response regulator KdpE
VVLALAVPLGHWLAAVAQGRLPRLQSFDVGVLRACGATPDLLILGLGLPDGDRVDLIHDLCGWSKLPVVVLSVRTDEADKIEALDAGADDYLVKPFAVGELLARVRAGLRRRASESPQSTSLAAFGECEIDLARPQMRLRGQQAQ